MIIFYFLLISLILIINILIIVSDYKSKIIPNKYLLYLLILSVIFFIANIYSNYGQNISIYFTLLSLFIIIFSSFALYYFGIWSAGDAKYILVLSLFVIHIGIIPLIGNTGIVILAYMLGYFFYFYLYKCIFVKNFAKSLFLNIKSDIDAKAQVFFNKNIKGVKTRRKYFYVILKNILFFLIFFVAMRLFRLEVIEYLQTFKIFSNSNSSLGSYLVIGTSLISLYILLSYRIILVVFRKLFVKYIMKHINSKIDEEVLKIVNVTIGIVILFAIILFDYYIHKGEVFIRLKLIFTIYLLIFILIRLLFYSYRVTFQLAEQDYIDINKLKQGDIVDAPHLISLFGTQACLGYASEKVKSGLLYPNPADYFAKIENPIGEEDVKLIKKIYKITNKYQSNLQKDYTEIRAVKILKTFPFALYLFLGFTITFIYGDNIAVNMLKFIFDLFKNYASHIHN